MAQAASELCRLVTKFVVTKSYSDKGRIINAVKQNAGLELSVEIKNDFIA